MKTKLFLSSLLVVCTLFTACAKKNDQTTQPADPAKQNTGNTNAGTSASVVDNADAFQKAISSKGTWIVAITKDLTVNKDLVVEGDFKNGKKDDKGNDQIQRKIALYSQDQNRNITARFTLTAPKMTFRSPQGSLQHGTFKGDLYVDVKDFQLIDAKVDGNVYFTSDENKATFKMDDKSSITGKQEVKK